MLKLTSGSRYQFRVCSLRLDLEIEKVCTVKNVIRRLIFANESCFRIQKAFEWSIARKLCTDILRGGNFITVYPLYRNDRFAARDECIRKRRLTCSTTFTKFNYWFFMTSVAMRMKALRFRARHLTTFQARPCWSLNRVSRKHGLRILCFWLCQPAVLELMMSRAVIVLSFPSSSDMFYLHCKFSFII